MTTSISNDQKNLLGQTDKVCYGANVVLCFFFLLRKRKRTRMTTLMSSKAQKIMDRIMDNTILGNIIKKPFFRIHPRIFVNSIAKIINIVVK